MNTFLFPVPSFDHTGTGTLKDGLSKRARTLTPVDQVSSRRGGTLMRAALPCHRRRNAVYSRNEWSRYFILKTHIHHSNQKNQRAVALVGVAWTIPLLLLLLSAGFFDFIPVGICSTRVKCAMVLYMMLLMPLFYYYFLITCLKSSFL